MRPSASTWWAPALRAVAFGSVAVAALQQDVFLMGGLSVLAVVWVFALFLGVAMAGQEWRSPPGRFDEKALFAWATLGSAAASVGHASILWIIVAWTFAAILGRFPGLMATVSLLVVGVLFATGSASAASTGMPWEILSLTLKGSQAWIGPALAAAAMLSWCPLAWATSEPPRPGRSGLPWLAVGLSLLTLFGWCLLLTTTWVSHRPLGVLAMIPTVACAAWFTAERPVPRTLVIVCSGVFASIYFADAELRGFWWASTLPCTLGLAAAVRSWRQRSWVAAVAAIALITAGLVSYPGLPASAFTSGAVAIPWVTAVWWVGSLR